MKSDHGARFGDALAVAGVLALTFLAFSPVLQNDFVNWDDPEVFQRNAQLGGPGSVRWAFTTTHMGHYQPLAWLVWSAVKGRFGLNAEAFHALSLLGHLLNGALVYLVCLRLASLAGVELRSRRVAALAGSLVFAVHPVRVEVVAWASAFPYVLSLAALLLALLAYLRSCTPTSAVARGGWLSLSIGGYAASLLARASAIGFPLMLLALDVYPLRRVSSLRDRDKPPAVGGASSASSTGGLLLEKVPFLILALAAAVAESRARELAPLQEVGLGARLTMAATAPFVYLGRTLLPVRLTPLDPLPIEPRLEWAPLVLSLAGLAAITAACWKARRTWPALPVAWVGYILLLGPVMGLTPSGQQATADRYMYLPGVIVSLLIGAAIAWVSPSARLRIASLPVLLVLLAALGVATWRQASWWHDSITLWTRAADLDLRNDIATYNLAIALAEAGRDEEAVRRYEQTLRLVPDHDFARRNLLLIQAGRAEREGSRLASAGRLDEAIEQYSRALALDSGRLHARAARGIALVERGRLTEAVADLRVAFDANVNDAEVANRLAFGLMGMGELAEAVAVLKRAVVRYPDDLNLAHNLARLLATAPNPATADGELALQLALKVRDGTGGRDPRVLDTLATAYAAAGQVNLARTTAEQAVALARQLGDLDLADEISAHAKRLRKSTP